MKLPQTWKHLRGHDLSNPIRTCGTYTARCACGVDVWGPTLPAMWTAHDLHRNIVRNLARSA